MKDDCSLCCISEGIEFFKQINPEKARKYGHKMAVEGATIIANMMGTELLIEDETMVSCMCSFRIPETDFEVVRKVMMKLMKEGRFNLYCVKFDEKIYGRVCGWISNELSDYE
jgi:hypothetical protein